MDETVSTEHHSSGMEWQLPIQKMEISNIQIGSPWMRAAATAAAAAAAQQQQQAHLAPLSYFSPQFRMPSLSVLFPPLPIIDYVPQTGRLVLDIAETHLACIKLGTLQETLIAAVAFHQTAWFKTDYTVQQIRTGFQPLLSGTHLIFHCPPGVVSSRANTADLCVGSRIRIAVKIHGLSFLNRSDLSGTDAGWTGRCRLQHRIVGILPQA
jgi:hypothetical protein